VVARLLATHGINPNQAMNGGATPLFMAAQKGHGAVVAQLLATPGIDPNQAMDGGTPPLIIACHENYPAVAALLLDRGADPLAAIDGDGATALKCAQRHPGFPPKLLARLAGTPQPSAAAAQESQDTTGTGTGVGTDQAAAHPAKRIKTEPGLLDGSYDCHICWTSVRPQLRGVAAGDVCREVLKCGTCSANPYHLSCARGEFRAVCPQCRGPVAPWRRGASTADASAAAAAILVHDSDDDGGEATTGARVGVLDD